MTVTTEDRWGTRFLAIGEPKAMTELRTAGRGPHCERERVRGGTVILMNKQQ